MADSVRDLCRGTRLKNELLELSLAWLSESSLSQYGLRLASAFRPRDHLAGKG